MPRDPFAPVARGRLIAYAVVGMLILVVGTIVLAFTGVSLPRALISSVALGMIMLCAVAGTMWLTGGERIANDIGPADIRLPIRLRRALPYMLAAGFLGSLFQLFELVRSK